MKKCTGRVWTYALQTSWPIGGTWAGDVTTPAWCRAPRLDRDPAGFPGNRAAEAICSPEKRRINLSCGSVALPFARLARFPCTPLHCRLVLPARRASACIPYFSASGSLVTAPVETIAQPPLALSSFRRSPVDGIGRRRGGAGRIVRSDVAINETLRASRLGTKETNP